MQHLIIFLSRLLGVAAGVVLLVLGIPLMVSPIPFGLLLIVLGAAILLASSIEVRTWLRRRRESHESFDAKLRRLEDRMPGLLRALLVTTRPPDRD